MGDLQRARRARTLPFTAAGIGASVALALAACGGGSSGGSASSGSSSPTSASNAGITVAAASVPGVGSVLVNGDGRTLYLLTSEKGGTLTCTDDNGCTKVWPDTELPSGTTHPIAGTGIQPPLLSTVKGPGGSLYITYAGWPLYTFSGDTGPGQARGQGLVSYGGTWETLSPSGRPVASAGASSSSAGSTTSSSSGSGY